MVLQDTWLFEGTIKENIIYSKQGVTDEQVIAACKAAGLHHFIKTLPEGYNTVLNDKANLSAGQKQLVTIARDMILVMRDGDIIESGNHNELLEAGGFYAELYNSQFEQVS